MILVLSANYKRRETGRDLTFSYRCNNLRNDSGRRRAQADWRSCTGSEDCDGTSLPFTEMIGLRRMGSGSCSSSSWTQIAGRCSSSPTRRAAALPFSPASRSRRRNAMGGFDAAGARSCRPRPCCPAEGRHFFEGAGTVSSTSNVPIRFASRSITPSRSW